MKKYHLLLMLLTIMVISLCGVGCNKNTSTTSKNSNSNLTSSSEPNSSENLPSSVGLTYTLLDDNTYEVSGFDNSNFMVIIPESVDGIKVTSIGSFAFAYCSSLTSIEIPDSITSIGDYAFFDCDILTNLTIGNSVTSIGESAFSGCSSLTKVNYLGTVDGWVQIEFVTTTSNPTSYAEDLYIKGELLTEAKITSATSINFFAFRDCSSLTSVEIGSSVTSIGSSAFRDCSSLTSVEIGSSVTSIGSSAFYGCYKLIEVYNKSNLDIVAGLPTYGGVADNAQNVYTPTTGESKLSSEQNGYIIYADGDNKFLVGYTGAETDLVLPSDITGIYHHALYGCNNLTSIEIPNRVTAIGSSAFYGCNNLTSIEIPNSVTYIGSSAFYGCSAEIIWGDKPTISTIGESAFCGYNGTSITIPNSVTYIGDGAFMDCDSLTKVNYLGTIDEWVQIKFIGRQYSSCYANPLNNGGNFYINDKLVTEAKITSATIINSYAFYGCSSLTSVEIGSSVTSIGYYAFDYCYKLIEVYNKSNLNIVAGSSSYGGVANYAENVYTPTSGESKHSTDENGFVIYDDGVNKILVGYKGTETNLVLPSNITEIYNYAFYGCNNLTSIEIPNSVTTIGACAFYYCDSLTSVTIGNRVTSIGIEAFYGCSSLSSVEIGSSVTSIGEGAFYGCSSLSKVNYLGTIDKWVQIKFESGTSNPTYYAKDLRINGELLTEAKIKFATKISSYAFHGCSSLSSVEIGTNITSIGEGAFYDCSSLTSIKIPNSVTSIGAIAFYNCSSLLSVTFNNTSGWRTGRTSISSSLLAKPWIAATYLTDTYVGSSWERS